MARPAGKESIEVRDGVYIKMRESGIWQVHFKLDGAEKAVRRSLKTKDRNEAKALALEVFDRARLRRLSGKPETAVGFEQLCEEYLASLSDGKPKTYHRDTIKRHLSPYFTAHVSDFSEIMDADVLDYDQWRRKKGKEPKAKTLNRENVVLRGLIKFAVKKGYLTKDNAPDIASLTAEKTRRDNFTRDQLKTLIETAKARIDETKNAATREQRQLLHDWIVVLAYTGLRPGEPKLLQWSDVYLDADELHLHIRQGKTKPRDVVPLDAAVDCLKAIRSRQRSYLSKQRKKLSQKHFVFSLPDIANKDLKQVRSFRTGFNNLLKACSFSDEKDGTSLAPYSLRHSYATMKLEEGTGVYFLAAQMGTGVKMIEDYYGHVITREQRAELTKTRDKTQSKSSVPNDVFEKFDAVIAALSNDRAETVVDVVRQHVLKEWIAENGREPDPTVPGDEEIFEGHVYIRMRELGHGDLYEPPDDLPDSLPD